jgi:predicted unusual protein kinase regulating ubiquinone biosynthesis (AarF/ABC1/UbiB family)
MQWRFLRSLLWSSWLLVRLLFWYVFVERILGRHDYIQQRNMSLWRGYAAEFRAFAVSMGGVMIKLGQFISTRMDMLPPEIIEELAGLQDEVPSVPFPKILAVIEADLGPIPNRFQWFNETPVAAASLGQVHRAQLLTGERVVVKVQRPGIAQVVYTDLAALEIVARVLMRFRFVSRRTDSRALIREFGRVLLEELSYEHEARNAQRFAAMFADDLGVYVPAVYTAHSTDRVLTMEDVTSIKINDYDAIEAAGINRKVVATRLMDTYLKQIFDARFFHADPHPGNLFIYPLPVADANAHFGPEGRPFYVIFVDFGMTGQLTEAITAGLINTLGAVIRRDARQMVRSYAELGFLLPSADLDRLEEATVAAFNRVWGLSMAEIRDMDVSDMVEIGQEFSDLLYDMPFYLPQDFVYLARAVGILSGMCTSLDPDFNPWAELQSHSQVLLRRAITTTNGSGPAGGLEALFNGNAAQVLLDAGQALLSRTLAPSAQFIEKVERGDIKFQVEPGYRLQRQLTRLEVQERRTTRAVVGGSFLIAAAVLYSGGDVALALIGFSAAGVTFLNVLFASGE